MTPSADIGAKPVKPVLAEGKTKILRPGGVAGEIEVEYKDTATAFNAQKKVEVPGKGALNARISTLLFERLNAAGVPTCFLRAGDAPNRLVYRPLTMIPLEVVVRNRAAGSIVKRLRVEEGLRFDPPVVEYFLKCDDDPLIGEDTIRALRLVPESVALDALKRMALCANEVLTAHFAARGITCVDFKAEFGVDEAGHLCLGDELSPDNFRLRDAQTGAVLDKDVFRLDLADLGETYRTLLARLEASGETPLPAVSKRYAASVHVGSRRNILNPESKAILEAVQALGHQDIRTLRAGKHFELVLEAADLVDAERQVRHLAETVLSNPVIEDFDYTLSPVGEEAGR